MNAHGRVKGLTRRVWSYHWRDKRMGHSGQLQYSSVNTRSALFTADDNDHPRDQQSSPVQLFFAMTTFNEPELHFIENHNVPKPLFSNRDSLVSKNETSIQRGTSKWLTLIFTTDFLMNSSLGAIPAFLSFSYIIKKEKNNIYLSCLLKK